MESLKSSLISLLANTYILYYKAQTYHWNIEGMNFPQLHGFFGDYYGDVYGTIDHIAEELRVTGSYAPISLINVVTSASIKEDSVKPATDRDMVSSLLNANTSYITSLETALSTATAANAQGLVDWITGRIDQHNKWGWQLKSILR